MNTAVEMKKAILLLTIVLVLSIYVSVVTPQQNNIAVVSALPMQDTATPVILNEKTETYKLSNGNLNGVFYSDNVFHYYQGKWYDLISFADISTDNNLINISYLNNSLVLEPYFVYQDNKMSYNSMSTDMKNQINLNGQYMKDRHDFKFGASFTKIDGVTEFGFDYSGNTVVTKDSRKLVMDGIVVVDFQDLVDLNYTISISGSTIRITNLKSGFNNLDPVVRFNSTSKDGEVDGDIGAGNGTNAYSNGNLGKVGYYADPELPQTEDRVFFSFNTSFLTSSARIDNATLAFAVHSRLSADEYGQSCGEGTTITVAIYDGQNLIGDALDVTDYNKGNADGTKILDANSYFYAPINFSRISSTGETDAILRPDFGPTSGCTNYANIRMSENAASRPYLNITYVIVANETEGRKAIEDAINNTLNSSSVYSDQQIYSVNQSGVHKAGKFDKVAVLNNQTWAFNYVTGSETPISMTSIGNTLVVWENQLLSYDEIIGQVESLINATKVW